ncbi:hypothetical protein PRIPAC_70592 [Pristionchus pacificus]|uniref:Uncharacterized protein n=1 Tax=Pristionchus pacificus TaxID=54126 RepID=A0A454Y0N7_PRIPA|nr:hypothetical protein PRIPAC_70592 [Pristionchus pacificus]|eukprot:PDM60777.1 hypothetical protein PRIPAC_54583 [Pristionchus pacificus]
MHRIILLILVAFAVATVALERDDFETWQYLYKRNMHGAKRTELNQLNSVLKKPVYNFMRIFGYRDQ